MKLEKAIEIQRLNIKEAGKQMPPDVLTALLISTHATERFRDNREDGFPIDTSPLVEETKD